MTMRPGRRYAGMVAAVPLVLAMAAAPGVTLAATGTAPAAVPPSPPTFEPWWLIPIGLGPGLISAIVIAVVRPATRRPILALGVFAAGAVVGTVFVLAGLFSDFSGQHRVAWPAVAIGLSLIAVGTIAALRVSGILRAR